MESQLSNLIGLILSACISLIGVTVTLVALMPVLIEIARTRSPDFFAGEEAKAALRYYLKMLKSAIVCIGISAIVSVVNFNYENLIMFLLSVILLCIGLVLLVIMSTAIADQVIKSI